MLCSCGLHSSDGQCRLCGSHQKVIGAPLLGIMASQRRGSSTGGRRRFAWHHAVPRRKGARGPVMLSSATAAPYNSLPSVLLTLPFRRWQPGFIKPLSTGRELLSEQAPFQQALDGQTAGSLIIDLEGGARDVAAARRRSVFGGLRVPSSGSGGTYSTACDSTPSRCHSLQGARRLFSHLYFIGWPWCCISASACSTEVDSLWCCSEFLESSKSAQACRSVALRCVLLPHVATVLWVIDGASLWSSALRWPRRCRHLAACCCVAWLPDRQCPKLLALTFGT